MTKEQESCGRFLGRDHVSVIAPKKSGVHWRFWTFKAKVSAAGEKKIFLPKCNYTYINLNPNRYVTHKINFQWTVLYNMHY